MESAIGEWDGRNAGTMTCTREQISLPADNPHRAAGGLQVELPSQLQPGQRQRR